MCCRWSRPCRSSVLQVVEAVSITQTSEVSIASSLAAARILQAFYRLQAYMVMAYIVMAYSYGTIASSLMAARILQVNPSQRMRAHTHANAHTSAHTSAHTHTHTHTHTHKCTHTALSGCGVYFSSCTGLGPCSGSSFVGTCVVCASTRCAIAKGTITI